MFAACQKNVFLRCDQMCIMEYRLDTSVVTRMSAITTLVNKAKKVSEQTVRIFDLIAAQQ